METTRSVHRQNLNASDKRTGDVRMTGSAPYPPAISAAKVIDTSELTGKLTLSVTRVTHRLDLAQRSD